MFTLNIYFIVGSVQWRLILDCNLFSFFLFFFYHKKNVDLVVELVGGGSVINGAYHASSKMHSLSVDF